MSRKKLSDNEFWSVLRANAGLATRTAQAIKREFNIDITRQAVSQRMKADPEQLADIEDQNLDIAEGELQALMRLKLNPSVKLRAIETYLKAKGKVRGYYDKSTIDLNQNIIEVIVPDDPTHDSD